MADYWRFADRMAPGAVPGKRLRSEFDVQLGGPAYYPREDPRFDERDRLAYREFEPYGSIPELNRNGLAYGPSALTSTELGTGSILGMTAPASGGLLSGLDDHGIGSGRMIGLDAGIGKTALSGGRTDFLTRQDSQVPRSTAAGLLPSEVSNTLFVEGLPADCTRREAAHVFRPFVGFKEVRLVRKEAKRPGGDQLVLCFVDFEDEKCAAVALESLQGYKFDDANPNSETLRLQFARYPGPRGGRDDFRGGRDREDPYRNRPFRR